VVATGGPADFPRRGYHTLGAVLSIASVLALGGCGSGGLSAPVGSHAEEAGPARLVDPDEFAVAVAEPGRVTINVHIPFEGDIDGTDLSIPFDQIASQAERLPVDRGTGLAIYCRSGPMSTKAAATLRDLGYIDVVELRGGMRAWQADGRPLIGA
jgi:rhodanese-related sulfurtransferase